MMTSLLDAVADRIGRGLQRFGVKRGIVAGLLGVVVVSVIVAGIGLYGLVQAGQFAPAPPSAIQQACSSALRSCGA